MVQALPVVVAAAVLLGTYLYSQLHYKRFKQYAQFPQLPTSLLFGHLKYLDQFIRSGKLNGHPGTCPDLMLGFLGTMLHALCHCHFKLRSIWLIMTDLSFAAISEELGRP